MINNHRYADDTSLLAQTRDKRRHEKFSEPSRNYQPPIRTCYQPRQGEDDNSRPG